MASDSSYSSIISLSVSHGQGVKNYGLWARSSLLPVFISKVLLGHSHVYWGHIVSGCFCIRTSELSSGGWDSPDWAGVHIKGFSTLCRTNYKAGMRASPQSTRHNKSPTRKMRQLGRDGGQSLNHIHMQLPCAFCTSQGPSTQTQHLLGNEILMHPPTLGSLDSTQSRMRHSALKDTDPVVKVPQFPRPITKPGAFIQREVCCSAEERSLLQKCMVLSHGPLVGVSQRGNTQGTSPICSVLRLRWQGSLDCNLHLLQNLLSL